MKKTLIILSCLIYLTSCKTTLRFQNGKVYSCRKYQLEERVPNKFKLKKVTSFFHLWNEKSQPISNEDFNNLDSVNQLCYKLYESFMSDSILIGENKCKYILLPNKMIFGFADGYHGESFFEFDNLQEQIIKYFRPRLFPGRNLYYFKEYQECFPRFAEKYGIGEFLCIDSYLMSKYPRFLETSPCVTRMIVINNRKEICIQYEAGTNSYGSVFVMDKDKWIKIKDQYILAID